MQQVSLSGDSVILHIRLATHSWFFRGCLLSAVLWLPACAAQETQLPADGFALFDVDGSGGLSNAEVGDDSLFSTVDGDQSGELSPDEVRDAINSGKIARDKVNSMVAERRATLVASVASKARSDSAKSPQILKPSEHRVGRYVADLAFTDLRGNELRLSAPGAARFTVLAMTSTSCPLSRKYLPTLAELSKQYAEQSVRFVLVNCITSDSEAAMARAAESLSPGAAYVADHDESIAGHLGAVSTTDVLILDSARTIVYHGAVDDQYGIGYALEQPRRSFLGNALESLLAGESPKVTATTAPGCLLDLPPSEKFGGNITWHNRISRIVQQNCGACHRDEGVGPFSLNTRDEVLAHAAMIRQVVADATMPPWFAAKTTDQHSQWSNDRSLTTADREDLLNWLAGDSPEGDPADAPVPVTYTSGWNAGEPDAIVQIPKPIRVRATGAMAYQNIRVDWTGTEDVWVRGYEIQPTDRSVVHHVLVTVQEPGEQSRRRDDGIGAYWAAYVPGNAGQMYPKGFARRLPAGSIIRFQIHYTPNGTATEDQVKLGLYFAEEPPAWEVSTIPLAGVNIRIPPRAANHVETLTRPVPTDIPVMAYMAHMHVRGKAFRFELDRPDGTRETLLDIPQYDFNWQLRYDYAEPRVLPKGSKVIVTAVYDNSEANPANPNPDQEVRWGEQTFEEMMIGYVETFAPRGTAPASGRIQGATGTPEAMFMLLDADQSGKLSSTELQQATERFPRLKERQAALEAAFRESDLDGDQQLSPDEFNTIRERLRRR